MELFQSGGLGTGSLAAMDEVKHDARGSGLSSTWRLGLLEEILMHSRLVGKNILRSSTRLERDSKLIWMLQRKR
jgi:hypothetical protein